jgi:O-antigen/teichoic acid export membrane protein
MAYKISNLPATEITHVVSQVTFPAYAKLQGRLNLLREAFSQVIQLTALMSFPLAGAIASLARPFVTLFLGEKWSSMIPTLQVLTLWGLIRSLDAATSPVWLGMGKPHLPTRFQLAKAVLLAALIYPLTLNLGVLGTALAVSIQSTVVHVWRFWAMGRTLRCGLAALIRLFITPALATALMSASLIAVTHLVPTMNLTIFFGLIVGGIAVYSLAVLTLGPLFGLNYHLIVARFAAKL